MVDRQDGHLNIIGEGWRSKRVDTQCIPTMDSDSEVCTFMGCFTSTVVVVKAIKAVTFMDPGLVDCQVFCAF